MFGVNYDGFIRMASGEFIAEEYSMVFLGNLFIADDEMCVELVCRIRVLIVFF